jgi:hypothetical protein
MYATNKKDGLGQLIEKCRKKSVDEKKAMKPLAILIRSGVTRANRNKVGHPRSNKSTTIVGHNNKTNHDAHDFTRLRINMAVGTPERFMNNISDDMYRVK